MFEKDWPILVVDDDPDVLTVSRLAMKNFQVDGRPITLFTANSTAAAIDLLNTTLSGRLFPYVAVAFIDVVMETDTAGLDLCHFMRETQKNRYTQLYIRTGQPGVAPERTVIDRYDINGYFTKVELTEDKLYSLVKAGVRQFDFTNMVTCALEVVTQSIARAASMDDLVKTLYGSLELMSLDAAGRRIHDYHQEVGLIIGNRVVTAAGYGDAQLLAERDRLERLGLQTVDREGTGYVIAGNTFMVKVPATDANEEAYHIMNIVGTPSMPEVLVVRLFTRAIAALAKRIAGTAQREAAIAG